ncbi:MAG: hypothetical protein RLZZ347_829 [Candidatus Parcubacteria bacterium]|jgi:hypothetical protein
MELVERNDMALTLTESLRANVELSLETIFQSGANELEVPESGGMVLVRVGTPSEQTRKGQVGNFVAEFRKGDDTFFLCNA